MTNRRGPDHGDSNADDFRQLHLVLGHGGPAILFTRRGAGDPAACLPSRSFAPYSSGVRNYQLIIWYVGNERVMLNRDRRIFGLPCRFPAKPTIFAVCGGQAYDRTGFFSIGKPRKKLFPGFPCAAGKGRGRGRPVSATRRGVAWCHEGGGMSPRVSCAGPRIAAPVAIGGGGQAKGSAGRCRPRLPSRCPPVLLRFPSSIP
jgi:hypothetical protein